ncbi:MAG: hypothetical protein ACE5FC_01595, partial [Myxococcota bacterium]
MSEFQPGTDEGAAGDRSRLTKLLLVAGVLVAVILAARNPEIRENLSQERLVAFIEGAGPYGPALFILIYAVWVTVLLPAIVPTLAGSILFPALPATIYIVLGATAGASSSFHLSRSA